MKLCLLKNANVSGKTVFLRADLDVPLSQQKTNNRQQTKIIDDSRLLAWMPTLEYLLKNGAKVIIAGHLGRPKGVDKSLSLNPVAKWISNKLKIENLKLKKINLGEFDGWEVLPSLFLLENLRFYEGEEKNDEEFAKKLAGLADVYVNDAFAASHRKHASIVGVPKHLPHFAGFRLEKEIEVLSKVLKDPERPLVVLIGGAKLETKLPLVEKMHHFADYVLVGGKIAKETQSLIKVQHEKLNSAKSMLFVGELNKNETDITDESTENFIQVINLAKTIIWNGPVGYVENKKEDSARASRKLAYAIAKSKEFSIVGGGDTLGFLRNIGLSEEFSFLSTGGGAMLEFLSDNKLPGIEILY